MSTKIIFEMTEDPNGGYNASALGFCIHTQADTIDALRAAARDAVATYFDEPKGFIVSFFETKSERTCDDTRSPDLKKSGRDA